MSSLGFTSKEQRNLGLLVHLMTTNPKILYSPIGSQADKVIQKASGSINPNLKTQQLLIRDCVHVEAGHQSNVHFCVARRQTRRLHLLGT